MTTTLQLVELHQVTGLNRWWWRCHSCGIRQPRTTTRGAAERSRDLHTQTQRHERNSRRLFGRRID